MSADPREVMDRPAPGPDEVVSYGEGPDRVADVFWPTGEATGTVVVLVHGGFWKATTDRTHTRATCEGLTAAGHAVAAIEYHRVGTGVGTGVGTDQGGWPGTLDDVAAAVDAVPGLVRALPRGADLRRTVLLGHSAGGHLVTWAVSRPSLPASCPWHVPDVGAAVAVSLGGAVDLALAHRLGLGDGAVAGLLGGGPDDVPDRFAQADPAALTPSTPVVLVHGTDDDDVPVEVARSYLRSAGRRADVRLVELPVEHFGVIDPRSPAWASVLDGVAGA